MPQKKKEKKKKRKPTKGRMLRSLGEDRSSSGSGSIIWLTSWLVHYALVSLHLDFPQRQFNPRRGAHWEGERSRHKYKLIFFFLLSCHPLSDAYDSTTALPFSLSLSVVCVPSVCSCYRGMAKRGGGVVF